MRPALKIAAVLSLAITITPACIYSSQDTPQTSLPASFQGTINAADINVRCDSTVSSKIICKMNKGDTVEVVRELYDWYKIRLPKTAPSFIKKNLVAVMGDEAAKVLKDNVNIRMQPNESSWILGKVDKNEVVNIVGERNAWYKIEPVNNSFGWINKSFVDKASAVNKTAKIKSTQDAKKKNTIIVKEAVLEKDITLEGIIKPYGKVFRRNATHKLITADNNVFLLRGNKESLDNLNYRKVKVTGKLIDPQDYNPIIEITKIEALD